MKKKGKAEKEGRLGAYSNGEELIISPIISRKIRGLLKMLNRFKRRK